MVSGRSKMNYAAKFKEALANYSWYGSRNLNPTYEMAI